VILNKTAKMRGDIYHQVLEIQPGADFEGKVAPLRPSPVKLASPVQEPARGAQETLDLPAGLGLRSEDV
jgi:cytoskeletal protein CcmA (bactofilin family)